MLSQPTPETSAFRLSPQQAFLLANPQMPLVSQCVVSIPQPADEATLRSALQALVAAYESLRTTFPTPVGARAPVAQAIHDLLAPGWSALAGGDDQPAEIEALLAREAGQLDLDRGPSLRALLVEVAAGPAMLVLTALAGCADPYSLRLVGRRLGALTDRDREAPAEPIQHADYAEWRHELAAGDDPDAARGRAFWSNAIEAAEMTRLLFGARERRSEREGLQRIDFELSPEQRIVLSGRAAELGVSQELVIHAAWQVLLARVSGQSELLTAGIAGGRAQPDLTDAIGPYAQVVPLPITVTPETRFVEVLDRLGRVRSEAAACQDYGLESDLAQVAERALAGFTAVEGELEAGVEFVSLARTGCALELGYREGGRLELSYDGGLYEHEDATDLAAQFGIVLSAALADPSASADELALVDREGRAGLLTLGSGAALEQVARPVHLEIERHASQDPDRPAVFGSGVELTFGELNAEAEHLARHLIALGVGRNEPVGLCLRRSPALLGALLGILKAGGGYVPLNFAHPPARIAHQMAESGARVLVTESELLDRLPPMAAATVVCVDRDREAIASAPADGPLPDSAPDDLAYIMYTSGSTGMPKGVAVTHGNLASYTAAIRDRLGMSGPVCSAVVSEISTDLGNTAIFPVLAGGGCVHLIDPELSMDGTALAQYMTEHEIELMKITPTHLRALLAADERCLPRRWLIVGGEALSWELADRITASGVGCRLVNHYGPTEATIGCSTFEVKPEAPRSPSATVPIGRPLPGDRTYILDGRLEPLPVGVVGELCVGGSGVARGYVNRPEETAERFVADPQGGRMYRTGDQARRHRDGSIEFLGRSDHQLKIRGYRVEPGEIEAALLRHAAVSEAAVLAREQGDGDPRLVAYYTAPQAEPSELQAFLAESLPEYMLPARWVSVSAFPLTASGKIDRRALPDPETVEAARDEDFVAPRDELEQEIAAIWAALLGVERVGAFDDFFALGGHSLLATQAIMRVRRRYGSVPLGAIFNSPTVAALAGVIRDRAASS